MGRLRNAAWKEVLLRLQMSCRDLGGDQVPRLLRDLKLHRSPGLLLHNNRPGGDVTALDHIMNAKADQIAPAQLAVDGEVEQREFPGPMIQLQSNPNGPDLLQLQWRLLAEQLVFVPQYCAPCTFAKDQTTGGPDKIKAMLLPPAGWKANWIRGHDKGASEIIFEVRGDKVMAKIRNLTKPTTCEHDVMITSDIVKFDACYDFDITFRFDPHDQHYPFKGTSGTGYDYKV
jgi:hypothetical protein